MFKKKLISLIGVFGMILTLSSCIFDGGVTPKAKVATPTFSVVAGIFNVDKEVELACTTAGATIHYTIDGSEPTSASDVYSAPIIVSGNETVETIKALAIKADMDDSDIASATYTITYLQLAAPVMTPASGGSSVDMDVSIAAEPGAVIHYTIDGSDPLTSISSEVYSIPIHIAGNGAHAYIKAVAIKDEMLNSVVTTEDYTINYDQVSTPQFSVPAATYNNDQSVEITCSTSGAAIYYTTDEFATPATPYTGAITVSNSQTIRAIATKTQMLDSAVASNAYVLVAATPSISPASGAVANGTEVTLTTATTGAEIRYTTNGVNPDGSSSLYNPSSKPTITTAITFKAIAIKSGYTNSAISSASYTLLVAGDKALFTAGGVIFKMAYVPGGLTFMAGMVNDTPTTVDNAYWIGETQVTYELWNTVKTWGISNGYTFNNSGREGNDGTIGAAPTAAKQEPVTTINWRDAMIWTNALTEWYNAINGTTYTCAYYTDAGYTTPIKISTDAAISMTEGTQDAPYVKAGATGFRMMTSPEWELAARYKGSDSANGAYQWPAASGTWWTPGVYASGATAAYNNATATGLVGWYTTNSGDVTHNVKGKLPNALVLYDMSGNVYQWCSDWAYGQVGVRRAIRGGNYNGAAGNMRLADMANDAPNYATLSYGFRIAASHSTVASNTYVLQAETPTISPASGNVDYGTEVTLTTATTGAEIRYTTNGVDPDGSSSLYNPSSKPAVTSFPVTFKAMAIKSGSTNSTVSSALYTISSDATLKATSTVKGQVLVGLGTPNAVLDSALAGSVTITTAKALDTSNLTTFITLFDKTDSGGTTKVVKYANGASTANFATDTAYANQTITTLDFFIIKVTSQDATTVLYYKIIVTVTPPPPVVGDTYQGGKIAYVLVPGDPGYDANVYHGLIAATVDQSTGIIWALPAYQFTAVAGTLTTIGSGSANTDKIIVQNAAGSGYAAGLARAYNGGGYTDWYLPSRDELNKLYLNKTAIGGFAAQWYWCSSQNSGSTAFNQYFGNGGQNNNTKANTYYIRAVRSF